MQVSTTREHETSPAAERLVSLADIREAQSRGAKLVVVDPRATQLALSADVHLAVKPGTDVVVALAVHRYLFTNGYADASFLEKHTSGWERLRERAEPWTLDRAAETAGIDRAALETIIAAAKRPRTASPSTPATRLILNFR